MSATSTPRTRPGQSRLLAVISVGGMLGASARYAAERAWPTPPGGFPWSTLAVNVAGSILIGVLMVQVAESRRVHPAVRPFLGVGVLGGFTTFSTYAVQTGVLLTSGRVLMGAAYLVLTVLAAMAAVTVGVWGTRASRALRARVGRRGRPR